MTDGGPRRRLLYELLLRLYPARFRERFGDGMRHAFAEEWADAAHRGSLALAALWLRTTVQAVALGLLERGGIGEVESRILDDGDTVLHADDAGPAGVVRGFTATKRDHPE